MNGRSVTAVRIPLRLHTGLDVTREAARVIRQGGIVALPTESFYALGASPQNAAALRRVFQLKGRPSAKPLLVLIADGGEVAMFAETVSPAARCLMDAFWPGPLTLVLPARESVSSLATGATGTIGLRWTADPLLRQVLAETGPLTGTSANRSGAPPARTADEVERCFGDEIDMILDGGAPAGERPSTIVHAVGVLRLLREGPITPQQLNAALRRGGFPLIGESSTGTERFEDKGGT